MCGRYFTDPSVAEELYDTFRIPGTEDVVPAAEDVHPADTADVLVRTPAGIGHERMRWGFPGFEKNQLIFNARAEGALEKRMFRDSVRTKRILVPSRGFYEWDSKKTKYTFQRTDKKPLLMAGCWNQFGACQRFVILTTEANESVKSVHHRMPLILDPEDAWIWLMDDGQTEFILQKIPGPLEKKSDYEQMTFSFLFHKEEPL